MTAPMSVRAAREKLQIVGAFAMVVWLTTFAVCPLSGAPQEPKAAADASKSSVKTRPQVPVKPYPYLEEEVAFDSRQPRVRLAGTLTLPRGAGPFPAALLITGSGPQDRDESIMGHKPFLVLADYLTRRGIAVLRVDDRGVGQSTGSFNTSTSADFAEDAQAGVDFLRQRKEINPKQVGLIGHSEGGMIAPMIAARTDTVAFVVMLAGQGLTGAEVMDLQGQRMLKASGASPEQIDRQRRVQAKLFAIVATEKDPQNLERQIRTAIDDEIAKLPDAEKNQAGSLKAGIEGQIRMLKSPWLRIYIGHDPRSDLRKLTCPVLALIGSKDLQVDADANLREIEKALREGGNKNFTVKELPRLNHLFQRCETGSLAEYARIEETIAPSVLELIGDWIVEHSAASRNP